MTGVKGCDESNVNKMRKYKEGWKRITEGTKGRRICK